MKKVKATLIMIIVMSITLYSCSSNEDEPTENKSSYIDYKLNNTQVGDSNISVFFNNSITLIEIVNTNNSIRLWLPVELTEGTYSIISGQADSYTVNLIDNINSLTSENDAGTITLTNVVANKITGTFEFTGTLNSVEFSVSEGRFSVSSFN